MLAGERQWYFIIIVLPFKIIIQVFSICHHFFFSDRIRRHYLRAVLRQEIGWFDKEGSNEV